MHKKVQGILFAIYKKKYGYIDCSAWLLYNQNTRRSLAA